MRKNWTVVALAGFLLFTLLVAAACSSGVAPDDSARLNEELATSRSRLADAEAKLADYRDLQAKYDALVKASAAAQGGDAALAAKYTELQKQYEAANSELESLRTQSENSQKNLESLETQLSALQANYDALDKDYQAATRHQVILEGDVEQAIFHLVNGDRVKAGLAESQWGDNLHGWASQNSKNMAERGSMEYSDYSSWQDIQWATGYLNADQMANAVLTIWKAGSHYQLNYLNVGAAYCAVGVYRMGDIYYITYIASPFR
ncbi:MAG: hypothetical protein ABID87_08055 [Chloroflexota bacterium]